MVIIEDSIAHFSHVGDSRLYLYRDEKLRRLTRDHTVVQKEIDAGRLTPELAKMAPSRDVLTQSIGAQGAIEPVTSTRPVDAGDILLLCTDGLTDVLDDTQIAKVMSDNPVEELPFVLVDSATSANAVDNITVVVLQICD
jgi:PPM family protein phosphatase